MSDRVECTRCGKSYTRRGLATHQRSCRASSDEYVELYQRYVLEAAFSDLQLGSSSSLAPEMHDPEDRPEVVRICRELEEQLANARQMLERVQAEMERVGEDMPQGPMRPLADVVDLIVRPKDKRELEPDEIRVTVRRDMPLASSDERDYLFLLLKYGLKYKPRNNAATRALPVPWPDDAEQEDYAARVWSRLEELREREETSRAAEHDALTTLKEMFTC